MIDVSEPGYGNDCGTALLTSASQIPALKVIIGRIEDDMVCLQFGFV